MRGVLAVLGISGLAALGGLLWQRTHPGPCSYRRRFWVQIPKPFIRKRWLLDLLAPEDAARVLEIGPGTGYYSVAVAERLRPGIALEICDVQRVMLDHTLRTARASGLRNLVPCHADATALPHADASFDRAFIMLALGEIRDQPAALSELARVLRPGGRLVVGELFGDPHMVRFPTLRGRASRAGLRFERRLGGPLGYVALFRRL